MARIEYFVLDSVNQVVLSFKALYFHIEALDHSYTYNFICSLSMFLKGGQKISQARQILGLQLIHWYNLGYRKMW